MFQPLTSDKSAYQPLKRAAITEARGENPESLNFRIEQFSSIW